MDAADLKVGIIGTGGWAHTHVMGIRNAGAKVIACTDIDPERARTFAQNHELPVAAPTADDLLNEVDAVCVVSADHAHAELSLKALRSGTHVLCEKPLALTLDDARAVADEAADARERGIVSMINFSKRNAAGVQEAMRMVREGLLGEVRHVHACYQQHWLAADTWGNWTGSSWLWRTSADMGSGGVLGDIGCHVIDMATAIVGDGSRVRCSLLNFPKHHKGKSYTEWEGNRLNANDTAIVEVELDAGPIALCQMTRWATGHPNREMIEVFGTEGSLAVDTEIGWNNIRVCLDDARHAPDWTVRTLKPTPTNQARFVRAITEGVEEMPTILRGAHIQSYLDACERSAESERWETLLPWSSAAVES